MYMQRALPGVSPLPDPQNDNAPRHPPGSPQATILAVLGLLDDRGIAYCIPHGWEDLPFAWGSDIDVIVAQETTPAALLRLFKTEQSRIGAPVVRARGGFISFGCVGADGLPVFLSFDFTHDYRAGHCFIASADTMLEGRRKRGGIFIPAAPLSVAAGFLRSLLRDKLDAAAALKLTALYAEAPAAARQALGVFLRPDHALAVSRAVTSGDWSAILANTEGWRRVESSRLRRAYPARTFAAWAGEQAGRIRRIMSPDGIHVALLGPDGAGKSSTIAALETAMGPLFARTEVKGFAPTLREILRSKPSSTATPHALKPRSLPVSLLRAAWWTVFAVASHATLRLEKTRSALILNDRHFIDILVDPLRYRYGGPRWVLRLVARLMPRPDAVILLHGPAEILQARKKELTVEETARQCRDYLALVSRWPRSHVVDATKPFPAVVGEAARIVLAKS